MGCGSSELVQPRLAGWRQYHYEFAHSMHARMKRNKKMNVVAVKEKKRKGKERKGM